MKEAGANLAKVSFPSRQLVKLAFKGLFAHSTAPLRIATYIGLSVALSRRMRERVLYIGQNFCLARLALRLRDDDGPNPIRDQPQLAPARDHR